MALINQGLLWFLECQSISLQAASRQVASPGQVSASERRPGLNR